MEKVSTGNKGLSSLFKRYKLFDFKRILFLLLVLSRCSGPSERLENSVSIKAVNGLQYDLVRFKVKPGSKVKITLNNVSDMSHNLLITKPGQRVDVVNAAQQLAEKGPQLDYVPKTNDVLWSIPVVSPGQAKSVTFTAPAQVGVYPYVCTYPGHGFIMYGAMYVTFDETLPDIRNDFNIPESRRQDGVAKGKEDAQGENPAASPHPYNLVPPYLYHVFIEGASPAAIAVHLPNDLSYCWDARACRLAFVWKGGFLDMSHLWKGHFDTSAKILGDIFYRDYTDYLFRLGESATVPAVEYKGYRLIDHYPEFHYTLNGLDVYELDRPKADSCGLIRAFRIPHADRVVWFYANCQDDAIEYEFSAGHLKDKKLKLSLVEAKQFTITMTSYHLAYKK